MEKTPADRPKSATDVLAALETVASAGIGDKEQTEKTIQMVASKVSVERPDLRPHAAPDGTVTILFSDIEGSSAMTERLGDRRAHEVLRVHNNIIR